MLAFRSGAWHLRRPWADRAAAWLPEVEPFGRLRHPGIVAIGPAPIHARPNAGQLAFGLWPVHALAVARLGMRISANPG
jgi:hypothetical protein